MGLTGGLDAGVLYVLTIHVGISCDKDDTVGRDMKQGC